MTITLPKNAEKTLALVPKEEQAEFISRAFQGELKVRELMNRKSNPGIEELVDGAYSHAQKLDNESDEKVFSRFNELVDEINS